jgi:hypothetical protein
VNQALEADAQGLASEECLAYRVDCGELFGTE